MKSKAEILEDSAAQSAINRNMRLFIVFLVVANVLGGILFSMVLYARFGKFPNTAFLGTTDAQSVCAPIGLDEPMVADAVARDYAVTAIRAIMTYDWTSWRDQLNGSTSQYMTLDGRNNFRLSLNDWGIVRETVAIHGNATAVQRAPALITKQGVSSASTQNIPRYEWEVTVPMTLIWRNATDRRTENRDFYATIVRTAKSPLNPKGIAIGRLVSSQPVTEGGLPAASVQAPGQQAGASQ